MATNWTPAEEKLLSVCKETIDTLIRDWSDDIEADPEVVIDEDTRYRVKDRVMVDRAVNQMWAVILTKHFDLLDDMDLVPVWRKAYQHAVNAYFRLYFGRRRGRPPLKAQELESLLAEERAGSDRAAMAQARNLDPKKGPETIRKRLEKAKKRLPTTGK